MSIVNTIEVIIVSETTIKIATQLKKKNIMWKISDEDEMKIETHYGKYHMNHLLNGCLSTKGTNNYMAILENGDYEKCQQNINKTLALFYSVGFISFDGKSKKPQYTNSKQKNALPKDIFLYNGIHFACVVILMEERRIDYYGFLPADQSRLIGKNKAKLRTSIIQVMLGYLGDNHTELNKAGNFSSNDWETNNQDHLWLPPQQGNRIDCGVFVCMYIGFIHVGCETDFSQEDVINVGWQKKIMLLMIPMVKRGDEDKDEVDEVIVIQQQKGMVFWKMAKDIIFNNKNWMESTVPSVDCWANQSMQIECKEDCQGREGCFNKRIHRCKMKSVRTKQI